MEWNWVSLPCACNVKVMDHRKRGGYSARLICKYHPEFSEIDWRNHDMLTYNMRWSGRDSGRLPPQYSTSNAGLI
jgi:hypothetical protein